jgi:hypothetical protein
MLVLVADSQVLERFRLLTESTPLGVEIVDVPLVPFTPLSFEVTDDDGIVAGQSTVSHVLAAAGVRVATDKVIGVYSNAIATGSGLVVLGAIAADNFIQLTYDNGTAGGVTNGPTTYTVFVARSP